MRTALGVPVIVAVLAMIAANTADASYCGAARYRRCKTGVLRRRPRACSSATP